MNIDVATLSTDGLKNLINNHRKKHATDSDLYRAALAEFERRKGLNVDKSLKAIRSAAKQHRFLSYKDLADASGLGWTMQTKFAIPEHLWSLVQLAASHGWPMLSAIVVNKNNVQTGEMHTDTLKGFIAAAHDLGRTVTDERDFLRNEQQAVFEWGERQP